MEDINEHLNKYGNGLFSADELNEKILIVYKIVRWAIRDKANKIVFYQDYIYWSKDEIEKGRLEIKGINPVPSFLDTLEFVLTKDEKLQQLLSKSVATSNLTTYSIREHFRS